jgi:putative ABC transport system substrate-binding protein
MRSFSSVSRLVSVLLTLSILLTPVAVAPQAPAKTPQIGVLRIGAPTDASGDTLRQALRDLGYTEGRNIVIADRWAEGRVDRLPDLAAELVRLKVDVIVASGVAGIRAAKQATTTIPIVMLATDPVARGSSRAWPGQEGTSLV